MPHKWRTLVALSFAVLLVKSVWFSASVVIPALTTEWHLTVSGQAWLTMSVQIGFVIGALASALFTIADRVPSKWLFSGSAVLAAICTIMIPLFAHNLTTAIILRLLTGITFAGVYPVGMKIMSTWTREDRGLAIGLMLGALAIGSATPHLLRFGGGITVWQPVLYFAAGLALAGATVCALWVKEGPYCTPAAPFRWGYVKNIFRSREVMLANVGYLGHMWELYAVWTWLPVFLASSFTATRVDSRWAALLSFGVIAVGGLGSLLAGKLADRVGRTTVTSASLIVSGLCSLGAGLLFGRNPALLTVVSLVWGFAIVADSAQFSAAVSELIEPAYIGTALTLQTSMGFLLTLVSIRLLPVVENLLGWGAAFGFLALGPILGIWAMLTLRRSGAALRLANGHR